MRVMEIVDQELEPSNLNTFQLFSFPLVMPPLFYPILEEFLILIENSCVVLNLIFVVQFFKLVLILVNLIVLLC